MRFLLEQGVPADFILMLTPQRTMQEPFLDLLYSPERLAGGEVTSATMGGLARRLVDLFWPLASEAAGFADPDQPPVFLSLETAQYYMAHIVRPLLDQGYFESVTMDRNRRIFPDPGQPQQGGGHRFSAHPDCRAAGCRLLR